MSDTDLPALREAFYKEVPNPRYNPRATEDGEPEMLRFTPVGWETELRWADLLDVAISDNPDRLETEPDTLMGNAKYAIRCATHQRERGLCTRQLAAEFKAQADPSDAAAGLGLAELVAVIQGFFGAIPRATGTGHLTTDRVYGLVPTSKDSHPTSGSTSSPTAISPEPASPSAT